MGGINRFIDRHSTGISIFLGIAGGVMLFSLIVFGVCFLCEAGANNEQQRKINAIELELEWRAKYGNAIVDEVFGNNSNSNNDSDDINDDTPNNNFISQNIGTNPLLDQSDSDDSKPIKGERGERFELEYYEPINAGNQEGYVMIIRDKWFNDEYILHDGF